MKTYKEKFSELLEASEPIIFDKKFIKNLEDYIFKNDTKYLKYITKNKSKIPGMFQSPNTFYRGMMLEDTVIESIKSGKPLKLKTESSWTTNQKVAEQFISDLSKQTKAKSKTNKGVIFKKVFTKEVILDIQSLIGYLDGVGKLDDFDDITKDSAIKESEVLIDKNISLTKKDILKVK